MEKRTGGCHCKKISYEVEIDMSLPVIECNCSHCQIKGLLFMFIPTTLMKVLSSENDLTLYRFNTHKIDHLFCTTCGVEAFGRGVKPDGTPTYAINMRSIDDIDLGALNITPYDGRSR
jgi:hypothetical protein